MKDKSVQWVKNENKVTLIHYKPYVTPSLHRVYPL
jgi:hypothetical protein